jgi:mycothiol S-conjugate amidase
MHEKFLELGLESPFDDERMARLLDSESDIASGDASGRPHVIIDISGHASVMRESLLAHATQVDPNARFWFGLPSDIADQLYPYDEYELARDLTGSDMAGEQVIAGLDVVPAI